MHRVFSSYLQKTSTLSFPFVLRWEGEPLSYVREAWTAAKPVSASSYFDTLKHLPSLKHGREHRRTIEKGPLSSHSLQADPTLTARHSNPLKVSVAYRSPAPRRTRPNGPCRLNIHFSLSSISPCTIAGHNRGISQKEMPEVWRRCLCSLSSPHYIWHCPGCYHSYVMECWVLITGCHIAAW